MSWYEKYEVEDEDDEITKAIGNANSISNLVQLLYELSESDSESDSEIYGTDVDEIKYVINEINRGYSEKPFDEIPKEYTRKIPEEVVKKLEELWNIRRKGSEDDDIIEAG